MHHPTFQGGDTVRIVGGAHGGRLGKVRGVGREAVHVEFQAPALLARPAGPTKSVTLPFAPHEIEHAADLIPAVPGRHRRVSMPNRDGASKATCTGHWVNGKGPKRPCPRHDAVNYPRVATHRAAGQAVSA